MIKLFEEFNERQYKYDKVKDWLDEMNIVDYHINDDLTVDVNNNVNLYYKCLWNIPVQFGKVTGHFDCAHNPRLSSLKGSPAYVGDYFNCSGNSLKTLKYAPDHVGQFFNCIDSKLTSLKGTPEFIGGVFLCHSNPLPSEVITLGVYNEVIIPEILTAFVKNQKEYAIWNEDGSFNKGRFNIFKKDFEAGILT